MFKRKKNSIEIFEKNKNLMYNNMTKTRERNFKYLLSVGRKAKGEATVKVNKILTLYNQSKISNITTAENIIRKLINNNTEKEEKKILKQYNKLISKYESNQPLNIRLKQAKNKEYHIVDIIFYSEFKKRQEGETDEQYNKRRKEAKLYKNKWEKMNILSFGLKISSQLLVECYRRLLINDNSEDTYKLFKNVMESISKQSMAEYLYYNVEALYILNYTKDNRDNKEYYVEPYTKKARDSNQCISMYSKYISTNIDTKYTTLKKSIENIHHIDNECWINTLYDYYGNTILSNLINFTFINC